MEIQKIFSDQTGEERYYSVLMSEEELDLYESMFSKKETEGEKEKRQQYMKDRKEILEFAHGKRKEDFRHESKKDEDNEYFYNTGKVKTSRKIKEAATLGGWAALAGAGLGHNSSANLLAGSTKEYLKSGKKGALIGAGIGAATGAGISYGIHKWGESDAKKHLAKDPHYYDAHKEYLKYKHHKGSEARVERAINREYNKYVKEKK